MKFNLTTTRASPCYYFHRLFLINLIRARVYRHGFFLFFLISLYLRLETIRFIRIAVCHLLPRDKALWMDSRKRA